MDASNVVFKKTYLLFIPKYGVRLWLDVKASRPFIFSSHPRNINVGRRAVLLARWIVRSEPLEIVGSNGHEKVPTRGKPGLERSGRPRRERIEGSFSKHLCTPHSTIRADAGVAIVPQTISRHLAEANLKSKRPFRALPLTPEHRQLRLQWCQCHRLAKAYDSRSPLIVMRGTLTGQRYVDDILRPHVGPFLNGIPGAVFQQDNARPHTARVAQDFLRPFQTLPWPARSPDLSL
ncbi:transposable element Tcb2 transposase [Trichonephila clavipes]|nr:transposable element Tcb2 transposase [Trichonephila clavipes]